jgi:hypothetical protein
MKLMLVMAELNEGQEASKALLNPEAPCGISTASGLPVTWNQKLVQVVQFSTLDFLYFPSYFMDVLAVYKILCSK